MTFSFALLLLITLNRAHGYNVKVGINGGREADPHSRPYMASLQRTEPKDNGHFCGGVLVREDFVLTARTCRPPGRIKVVLGAHNWLASEDTQQSFAVSQSILHPEFQRHPEYLENDLMLLRLDGRATLTPAVQVLPMSQRGPYLDSVCSTAGWGVIGDNKFFSWKLHEAGLKILSKRECQRRWGAIPIPQKMVCAPGITTSGDKGGPMVCNGTLAGIVSFTGKTPRTDVYMRISSYRTWIEKMFSNNEL